MEIHKTSLKSVQSIIEWDVVGALKSAKEQLVQKMASHPI